MQEASARAVAVATKPALKTFSLDVLDADKIKGELALVEPASIAIDQNVDPELDKKATEYAEQLVGAALESFEKRTEKKMAVENLGRDAQKKASQKSKMLQQPIKALAQRGEDGGPVANALIDLKVQVESLDPTSVNLSSPSFVTKVVGLIPGLGTPLARYFARYESAQVVIDAIIHSLEEGARQLERDNITLRDDQGGMRGLTLLLERHVQMGILLDAKLERKVLDREKDEHKKFIQEELLFPLRKRITALQTQLVVNQQGVVALEVVIRNNQVLIEGVNQTVDTTVSALRVAVVVALGLANQKIVLDKITAVNKTTSDLIASTARKLRQQGVDTHKQATESALDMNALESAWSDVKAAMEDLSSYRQNALPKMAENVLRFAQMTAEGEKVIQDMERGNQARPAIAIEVS